MDPWEPDPAWRRLRGGGGNPATLGLWAAESGGRRWIVKRLQKPDDPLLRTPTHAGYWRREAEVALRADLFAGPGLGHPEVLRVDEDAAGVTIWLADVAGEPPTALFAARALGVFAARPVPEVPWASTAQLAGRLMMAERNGGWPTLRRTSLAEVTEALWERRTHWLGRLAAAPQGQVHGDATPGNLLASRGADVVAVDWQAWGTGPVGGDLGYFSLSCREDFSVLLEAFLDGVRAGNPGASTDEITTAARVTAVYTVVSRAEWTLSVASRGGVLGQVSRHPSVAPHLRALQRQLPQIEALLHP
jgi:hypothetical protein